MIFGFEEIENNIIKLFKDNKLHHCNLIYGSEGVGKNTFITENIAPVILDVGNIEKTKKLILNGGHTDFIKLNINSLTEDGKESTSKKNEINVSQARRVINEIRMTPSISKYKLLIIDSIDKLNVNAQNVLLKTLEEPPKNTFIFLICNNIDKTIKTIISRSNIILVPPLKIESWVKAVFGKEDIDIPEMSDEEVRDLYILSNQSVNMAINILQTDSLHMYQDILELLSSKDFIKIQSFLDKILNDDRYDIFCAFLDKIFSDIIHYSFDKTFDCNEKYKNHYDSLLKNVGMTKIIKQYDLLIKTINEINIYNLDKKLSFNVFFDNFF